MGCVALPWDPPPPSALVTKQLISGVVGDEQYKMLQIVTINSIPTMFNLKVVVGVRNLRSCATFLCINSETKPCKCYASKSLSVKSASSDAAFNSRQLTEL